MSDDFDPAEFAKGIIDRLPQGLTVPERALRLFAIGSAMIGRSLPGPTDDPKTNAQIARLIRLATDVGRRVRPEQSRAAAALLYKRAGAELLTAGDLFNARDADAIAFALGEKPKH